MIKVEMPMFWDVIVSAILKNKSPYEHASNCEW